MPKNFAFKAGDVVIKEGEEGDNFVEYPVGAGDAGEETVEDADYEVIDEDEPAPKA